MTVTLTRRDVNRTLVAGAAALFAPFPATARVLEATPLFDFAIAGGWYYELSRCLSSLAVGERLILRAEADNAYDSNAIVVERACGAKLGYVPRCANLPVAALLRDGGRVEAVIVDWLGRDSWDDGGLAFTSFGPGEPRVRLSAVGGGHGA